ncbi:hypothetical protein IFM89_005825 [Coptis chinensis]|uniref:AMP-dependent synthetase/ligase domain-containing protein n=1 Tax=Coptis chinensis TaxID=261450 RepID=A0A835GUJ4_9MAGN|nr:hypothetical protein IFM89_005825 [Coptis chinensis]
MERLPEESSPAPSSSSLWKNYRVISAHHGPVRPIAIDPNNSWFCTSFTDRTIKIWDLGIGVLKHTLTGHIGQVRVLVVSPHHTYMFSVGNDKQVKVLGFRAKQVKGYGMTEAAGVSWPLGSDKTKKYRSVGNFSHNMEAMIVDHITNEALPPGKKGELWLRGPIIMKAVPSPVPANEDASIPVSEDENTSLEEPTTDPQ